jgi:hypothetical protein
LKRADSGRSFLDWKSFDLKLDSGRAVLARECLSYGGFPGLPHGRHFQVWLYRLLCQPFTRIAWTCSIANAEIAQPIGWSILSEFWVALPIFGIGIASEYSEDPSDA